MSTAGHQDTPGLRTRPTERGSLSTGLRFLLRFCESVGRNSKAHHSLDGESSSTKYPYGGIIVNSDIGDDRYQFTGKERDTESGLDNFGARYDSSQFGRFMSPDPNNVGSFNYDPQSWNAYAYARNNPLNFVDPDGHLYCRVATDDEEQGGTTQVCDVTDYEYQQNPEKYEGYFHAQCECDEASDTRAQQNSNQPDPNTTVTVSPAYSDMLFDAVGEGTRMARPGVNAAVAVTAPQFIFMGGASVLLSGTGSTLSGGAAALREAAIRGIQYLAELVQTGQKNTAEAVIEGLTQTPEGQALLRAMEQQLNASMSQTGGNFGTPEAFRLFQNLKAMIEPLIRH
jgi:RHS repeat-associated protein